MFQTLQRFFTESVLAPWIHEASAEGNRPYWPVVVVVLHLDGHHFFCAKVRTLLAMVEEKHNAGDADLRMLWWTEVYLSCYKKPALRVVGPQDEW